MSEHLAESLRPWLQQPAAARIAHLQAPRWIGTQAARNALDLLQACLDRAPALRTRGVMLIGPYANGKSMIAERFAIMDRRRAETEPEQRAESKSQQQPTERSTEQPEPTTAEQSADAQTGRESAEQPADADAEVG